MAFDLYLTPSLRDYYEIDFMKLLEYKDGGSLELDKSLAN
jgi:hypothetical protein